MGVMVAHSWLVGVNIQCNIDVVLTVRTPQQITPSHAAGGWRTSHLLADQHMAIVNCYTHLSTVHAYSQTRGN